MLLSIAFLQRFRDLRLDQLQSQQFPTDRESALGGQWYTFDARNNVPRIGRVLMARGRDAADVAITTTFGQSQLQLFKVGTDEVSL